MRPFKYPFFIAVTLVGLLTAAAKEGLAVDRLEHGSLDSVEKHCCPKDTLSRSKWVKTTEKTVPSFIGAHTRGYLPATTTKQEDAFGPGRIVINSWDFVPLPSKKQLTKKLNADSNRKTPKIIPPAGTEDRNTENKNKAAG